MTAIRGTLQYFFLIKNFVRENVQALVCVCVCFAFLTAAIRVAHGSRIGDDADGVVRRTMRRLKTDGRRSGRSTQSACGLRMANERLMIPISELPASLKCGHGQPGCSSSLEHGSRFVSGVCNVAVMYALIWTRGGRLPTNGRPRRRSAANQSTQVNVYMHSDSPAKDG